MRKIYWLSRDELSVRRLWDALLRRFTAMPHHARWELARLREEQIVERLRNLKGKHSGQRCFIIGNGPSLREMDLSPLKNEITFGLNRIYLNEDTMGFSPTYFICINELVLEQSAEPISKLSTPRFLNWNRRSLFPEEQGLFYLRLLFRPHFSKDLQRGIWGGATVTYAAMQVAYYMGFEQVILIGVDHSYSVKGRPHKTVVSVGEDRNHFSSEYFPEGFRWQLPDLSTSEYAYGLARQAYERDNRALLDATVKGQLQVFPKVDYQDVVD